MTDFKLRVSIKPGNVIHTGEEPAISGSFTGVGFDGADTKVRSLKTLSNGKNATAVNGIELA